LQRELLLFDGVANVALGGLLIAAPLRLAAWLGISATNSFFAILFGAVLVGIGFALLLELYGARGLGLTGALTINFCFGLALGGWLIFGGMNLPVRGQVVLWGLVVILVALSGLELVVEQRRKQRAA
jgi:hypothetical protein